jgi:RHS repeat-associated protein
LQTQYTYEAFGRTSVSGATSVSPFQFTGREHDGPTGLYYYRARYYHPSLHRFISEDPVHFGDEGLNLYPYVLNDPMGFRDPTGEFTLATAALGAGIGAAVAVVSTVISNPKATWTDIGKAAAVGGLTGFTAGFSFGTSYLVGAAVGAAIGAASDYASQRLTSKDGRIDTLSIFISGVAGAVSGVTGTFALKGGATAVDAFLVGSAVATGVELGLRIQAREAKGTELVPSVPTGPGQGGTSGQSLAGRK